MRFLGGFARLQKTTISLVMSVCQSIRPSSRKGKTRLPLTEFHEIWYLSIFPKSVEKIQVSLKSEKNNGRFI